MTNPFERPSPFLKWPGGKARLYREIAQYVHWGGITFYVEPFLGGGGFYFSANIPEGIPVILSDSNKHLINTYRVVRDSYICVDTRHDFQSTLDGLQSCESEDHYFRVRSQFNHGDYSDIGMAAAFIFLNKRGFNGLCRFNSKGEFNVPFGKRGGAIYNRQTLDSCGEALQRADIRCCDFRDTLKSIPESKGGLIYLDPPYAPIKKESFVQYTSGFGEDEHRWLASFAFDQHRVGNRVVISNANTPFTQEIYQGMEIREVFVARSISASSKGRVEASEIIAINEVS